MNAATRPRSRTAAQERRAATERAILGSTEQLLEARPFRDVTIEDVMVAAGLSRTAFYRYFPDLESVVVRLMGQLVDDLHAASAGWLTSTDPAAQLHDSLLQFAEVYREHGRIMQAFYDACGAGPDLKELWANTLGVLIAPLIKHTQELIANDRADAENPTEIIRALAIATDRYLLDVYWKSAEVPADRPAAVLEQLWTRTLNLR
jgi:AcrR family transcriptional regulator